MRPYEEQRQSMISTVASLNCEKGLSDLDAAGEVDEFIAAIRADERMRIRSKAHSLMVGADGKVQVWTVNDDDLRVPNTALDTP